MAHAYNGILFVSLKENLDTHFNMDEPGGYYTK